MVTVLIPAHNEEQIIEKAILAIFNQSFKPSQVIVIADNCTDNTVAIANLVKNKFGEKLCIYETVDNKFKKAGALNQAFHSFCIEEFVLVVDADTIFHPKLLEEGIRHMQMDDKIGAVSSMSGVMDNTKKTLQSKIIHKLQKLEYAMFDAVRVENYENIRVCAGMCTLYRTEALKDVLKYRKLKNKEGQLYLNNSLAEDYELTLVLKQKWKAAVNLKMKAWTEVPLNLKELLVQRERWYRGGVDCLRLHGLHTYTFKDFMGHLMFWITLIMQVLLISFVTAQLFTYGKIFFDWFMLIILSVVFFDNIYRMKYIENIRYTDVLFKLTFIPDLFIMILNMYSMIVGYYKSFFITSQEWR
jgi:cellulose synthase/poly-beta-1,6-N-acetylglucosamine synthase-like glycosyltransferase